MTYGGTLFAAYYAQHASRLPAGYREVEYLESTGAQWIDTGLSWGTYDWEAVFGVFQDGNVRFGVVSQNSSTGTWNAVVRRTNANAYRWKNYTTTYSPSFSGVSSVKVSCASGLWLDGVNVSSNVFEQGSNSVASANIYLFLWYNVPTGTADQKSNEILRLGAFDINSVFGVPRRRYIPCVRTSDNKPGMYDLCGSICPLTNSPFYINSGTGADFLWGELS